MKINIKKLLNKILYYITPIEHSISPVGYSIGANMNQINKNLSELCERMKNPHIIKPKMVKRKLRYVK